MKEIMKKEDYPGILWLISTIRERGQAVISEQLREKGYDRIGPSHGQILYLLKEHGSLNLSKVAELLFRKRSTVSVLARRLEEEGLVEYKDDPDDGRGRKLQLTKRARNLAKLFRPEEKPVHDIMLEGINDRGRTEFRRTLLKVLSNLRREISRMENSADLTTEIETLDQALNAEALPTDREQRPVDLDTISEDVLCVERSFTGEDILAFAEISGDRGEHHITDRAAKMAHGLLVGSLATEIGGRINYIARTMTFEFLKPVYEYERILCRGRVENIKKTRLRWKCSFTFECINTNGEVVMQGSSDGQVLRAIN